MLLFFSSASAIYLSKSCFPAASSIKRKLRFFIVTKWLALCCWEACNLESLSQPFQVFEDISNSNKTSTLVLRFSEASFLVPAQCRVWGQSPNALRVPYLHKYEIWKENSSIPIFSFYWGTFESRWAFTLLHSIIENRSRFAFCSKSARLKKSRPLLATFMKNAICISMKHAGSDAYFTQIIYPHYLPLISIRFESSSSARRFTMDPKLFLHSHPGRWFQNRAGSNQHV